MTMKCVIREDDRLLKAASEIFGDIVSKAFVIVHDTREFIVSQKRSLGIRDANALAKACVLSDLDSAFKFTDGNLDYAGSKIVLEFSNGRQVEFSNSEWANIIQFNPSSYSLEWFPKKSE